MTETTSCGTSDPQYLSLPPSITVSTFIGARIKEIEAMRKNIYETSGTKMAFQKLPKHLRRRAMSHAVKRLPRRLREIHINQMKKSGLPPKSKRPTRRYRRRPRNLQTDYARRQRRIKWLNTHIWHAKRFHMIEKWGFKLPQRACDKSFRACYRATTQHCLIQDVSYERCIEINGAYEDIIEKLLKLTNTEIGLTFGAKCFNEGKKFGELTLLDLNKKVIGNVEFLWNNNIIENNKLLWIFVHPAYYQQVLDVLIQLFELSLLENQKLATYTGCKAIILKELEYELGRFRLTGPLSTAVLKNALRVVDFNDKHTSLHDWLKNYSIETLSEQNETFKNITNTNYLPPNLLLSIIVHDPRLNLPNKRTKALLPTPNEAEDFDKLQKNLSLSPLFNDKVRNFVKENKISNAAICELRSKFLVPGTELTMDQETILPVVLMWRPGKKNAPNKGYSSGWDIIVPSSWSQSFFMSFVMWGGRAGGLRERESIAFERSDPDILYPDTEAGEKEETFVSQENIEKFFRMPPNKRTNFIKFGITSPFSFNWKMLISEWSDKNWDSFTVLRNKNILKNIQEFLAKPNKGILPPLPDNCLLPIKVTPINKGVCSRYSIICLPGDCEKEIEEPNHKDLFAQKRKNLRLEHKTLLKKLRKRRKRGKPVTSIEAEILRNYRNEMRKLWLPEPQTIRSSCSRPVIGFLKCGDFSFTLGQPKGLGYIVGNCLSELQSNKLLIRNPNSKQYKRVVIDVIVE